ALCPARRGEPPAESRARPRLRTVAGRRSRHAQGIEAAAARPGPVHRRQRRGGGVQVNALRAKRLRLFALGLALWSAFVVGRLVQLQVVQGQKYRVRAQRQQERRIEVAGRRGAIVDRQGRQLAGPIEVSSVYAIADEIEDERAAAQALAPVLKLPPAKVAEKLSRAKGFVWLARKVDPGVADAIRGLKVKGVHLVAEPKRFYPKGTLAAA